MKKGLIVFAMVAMAASVSAFAQDGQAKKEKFYSVVPKHEFTVNGFGGVSTLLYKADLGYNNGVNGPYWRGEADSDLFNIDEGFFHPTGFGGGGGFSYIWHFHPNVGLMTGVDLAYYSGGIRNLCPAIVGDQPFTTAYITNKRNTMSSYAVYYGVHNYSEQQKYMALQVPVMFQFMAPMGRGNNHFYLALGARFGFNVYSRYEGLAVSNSNFGGLPVSSTYTYSSLPYATAWRSNSSVDINQRTHLVELYPWYPYLFEPEGKYPWYQISAPITSLSDLDTRDSDIYHPKGKWGAKLVNVMASVELGFRWRLSDGLGLYTAVYADYGIPTINKKENVALITGVYNEEDVLDHETHSILNAQTAPVYWTRIDNHGDRSYMYDDVKPVASAHTLAFGLKLKLAFGKISPVAPAAPAVLPKPDTLSTPARDTVERVLVIRDTVIKVVHDTVYVKNTVIKTVTDTVTIVKEVPADIQQTMRELSGGLFKTGSAVLNKSTAVGLDKVADWIKATPKARIQIAGYTDSVGSDASNLKLSQARAKAVYTYLVSKGCNAKMLSYKGYGKKDPVADNSTAEGRAANRRVELKILQ